MDKKEKSMLKVALFALACSALFFTLLPFAKDFLNGQREFTAWMSWWDLVRLTRLGIAYLGYSTIVSSGIIGIFFLIILIVMCCLDVYPPSEKKRAKIFRD